MSTHVIPLDGEGAATVTTRGRFPGWLLALAAALVVIALVAGAAFWWTGREGSGPHWTIIDTHQPVTADPQALVARLEATGGSWHATLRSGAEVERNDWSDVASLDVTARSRGRHVISNLEDAASVGRNGRLLLLGPAYRPAVDELLRDDPVVFADSRAEDARRTYRLGGWMAYYSPAGATTDRTHDVETYLDAVARCPYDADPCPGGAS